MRSSATSSGSRARSPARPSASWHADGGRLRAADRPGRRRPRGARSGAASPARAPRAGRARPSPRPRRRGLATTVRDSGSGAASITVGAATGMSQGPVRSSTSASSGAISSRCHRARRAAGPLAEHDEAPRRLSTPPRSSPSRGRPARRGGRRGGGTQPRARAAGRRARARGRQDGGDPSPAGLPRRDGLASRPRPRQHAMRPQGLSARRAARRRRPPARGRARRRRRRPPRPGWSRTPPPRGGSSSARRCAHPFQYAETSGQTYRTRLATSWCGGERRRLPGGGLDPGSAFADPGSARQLSRRVCSSRRVHMTTFVDRAAALLERLRLSHLVERLPLPRRRTRHGRPRSPLPRRAERAALGGTGRRFRRRLRRAAQPPPGHAGPGAPTHASLRLTPPMLTCEPLPASPSRAPFPRPLAGEAA